jgi:hypothetical protein
VASATDPLGRILGFLDRKIEIKQRKIIKMTYTLFTSTLNMETVFTPETSVTLSISTGHPRAISTHQIRNQT